MKKRIKIHGFIIFLAVIIIISFPKIFLRDAPAVFPEDLLTVLGIASVLLGQIFRLSSRGFTSELSKNGFALVESGPYAFVRNPMYLGIILIGLGLVLMLFKWWAICIFFVFFALIYLNLIFQEEKKLIQAFPGAYEAYRKKVPAIIPTFKMVVKTEMSAYLPLKLPWIKREVGSISGVLAFATIIKCWESLRGGGYLLCVQRFVVILLMITLSMGLAAYLIKKTDELAKSV